MLPTTNLGCMLWVVRGDGRALRKKTPEEIERFLERGGKCPFGCHGESDCAQECGVDPVALETVNTWMQCGGMRRFCWPASGGLAAQPSRTIQAFNVIDLLVAYHNERNGDRQMGV